MDPNGKINVLLVDDQPGKLLSYEVMLRDLDANLLKASCANEALQLLLKNEVAVILIDVCMPELDGFELAAMIRQHPRFQKTALIFISAIHLSESDYLRGYDAGAVDYVPVPVVPELLRAKVRIFAELYQKTKQLESLNRELEQRVADRTVALESAHHRLMQSDAARGLALASGSMGSWEYDLATDLWNWDAGLRQIFGVGNEFEPNKDTIAPRLDPHDVEKFAKLLAALSPQNNTFQSEIRVLRDNGETRWCLATTAASLDAGEKMERLSGVLVDITDRKEAEAMQILLTREVDHRARNALAVVQAIVRLARADTVEAYVKAVEGRIQALAHTHELLSKSRWQGADIERLIAEEIAPYREADANRIATEGPPVILSPERAQAIGLVLHELATNAAKYGAFFDPAGRLDVRWSFTDSILTLVLAGDRLPRRWSARPQGLRHQDHHQQSASGNRRRYRIRMADDRPALHPDDQLPAGKTIRRPRGRGRRTPTSGPPASPRVLVVEDEALVGMLTTAMVREMGYSILGPMTTIADAKAVIGKGDFDVAVIDLNLNGLPAYPLADALNTRGVPFIFVTGYATDSIERRFAHIPIIQKPIPREELANAIAQVVADKKMRSLRMAE